MKIGDYVRTKSYGIRKINGFSSTLEEDFIDCNYNETTNVLINKKEIIKSSPNIIDLIEVGDYVNGHKVLDIAEEPKRVLYLNDISQKGALIPKKNIKSIVTKEQFEAMQYVVGDTNVKD